MKGGTDHSQITQKERNIAMEKSKVYQRGQVWYWEDPIYGRKHDAGKYPPGEAPYRGNRYMIIVQAEITINDCSILCIPCSSANHNQNDVQIPVASLWHEGYSYAKCRCMFPVHPKYLKKFICTLPDDVMSLIDAEIVKLCLPSVRSKLSDEEIKEFLGIDLNATQDVEYTQDEHAYEEAVVRFMQKDLVYTGSRQDKIEAVGLKIAFDVFCVNNDIVVINDMVRFMDTVMRNINPNVTRIYGWDNLDTNPWNVTELQGIKLIQPKLVITQEKVKGAFKLMDAPLDNKPTTPSSGKGKNVWDQTAMKAFCKMYAEKGVDETAKFYGLGRSTTIRYNSKFMAKISSMPAPQQAAAPSARVTLPTSRDVTKSVSKISNMIRDYLVNNKIHKSVKETKMVVDEFYAKLQSSIYYSLLELLNVRVNGSKVYIPALTENSPNLNTWRFFDFAYHDQAVSRSKDIIELSKNMATFHGVKITSEWISILTKRLVKRGVTKGDVEIIFKNIWEMIVE